MDFFHQVTSAFGDPGSVLQAAGPWAITIVILSIIPIVVHVSASRRSKSHDHGVA